MASSAREREMQFLSTLEGRWGSPLTPPGLCDTTYYARQELCGQLAFKRHLFSASFLVYVQGAAAVDSPRDSKAGWIATTTRSGCTSYANTISKISVDSILKKTVFFVWLDIVHRSSSSRASQHLIVAPCPSLQVPSRTCLLPAISANT